MHDKAIKMIYKSANKWKAELNKEINACVSKTGELDYAIGQGNNKLDKLSMTAMKISEECNRLTDEVKHAVENNKATKNYILYKKSQVDGVYNIVRYFENRVTKIEKFQKYNISKSVPPEQLERATEQLETQVTITCKTVRDITNSILKCIMMADSTYNKPDGDIQRNKSKAGTINQFEVNVDINNM